MKTRTISSTLIVLQLTNRVPSNNHSLNPSLWRSDFLHLVLLFALAGFALLPTARAVDPPPDGGYRGGNTAEGSSALFSLTTGTYNTALGVFSLRSNMEGNFNTASGAGTLLLNTANENTATGAGALLSNTTGTGNLADGAFALFNSRRLFQYSHW